MIQVACRAGKSLGLRRARDTRVDKWPSADVVLRDKHERKNEVNMASS